MVDTKTVQLAGGVSKKAYFVVLGNPCKDESKIPYQAPDVKCEANGDLVKATLSDHGYIIVGMFFEPGIKDHSDSAVQKNEQVEFSSMCQSRAAMGHQSGMGMIFRQVAAITPIKVGDATTSNAPSQAVAQQESGSHGGSGPMKSEGVESGKAAPDHSGHGHDHSGHGAQTVPANKTNQESPPGGVSFANVRSVGTASILALMYAMQ